MDIPSERRKRKATSATPGPPGATHSLTEGDLIIGLGSRSAMVTLRERVTHFGIIVNLPDDHTAVTVNAAVRQAFAGLPPHLVRTLTWDQGTEMARHRELAAATGLRIYFAERSSP